MSVRRGEVYWVEFDSVKGSEQGGLRPALVVQNDVGNPSGPTTIVAAFTRTVPPRPYPFVVVIDPMESGLPERSVINCSQLGTIQQSGQESRLRPSRGDTEPRSIGTLSSAKVQEVDRALTYSLGVKFPR